MNLNEFKMRLMNDKYLLQEQVMSLKYGNLKMQNSKEELEQHGK